MFLVCSAVQECDASAAAQSIKAGYQNVKNAKHFIHHS